jgi:hypothetical protein
MSAAIRPPHSDESRRKRSEMLKGKVPVWMHTPEIKQRAGARRKGRVWITDGTASRTIMPEDELPDGWRFGRLYKR